MGILERLAGSTGQSVGKRLVGTRLEAEDGSGLLGGRTGVLRCVFHVADSAVMNLGFLWPLWDAKRQTFADKLVHSVVVRLDR